MNKLIQQLTEQAEFSEKDLHIQGDNFQKFAELIVKECTNVVAKLSPDRPYMVNSIKKHFEIEE